MAAASFGEIVLSWRRLLVRGTIACTAVAVVISLLLPRWFEASAVLTPPEETDAGLGLMSVVSQISSTVNVGRTRGLLKRTAEVDLMIGVLKSRRLRGAVVDSFDLVERYDVKTRDHAIKQLGTHLSVETTPEGFVDVRVEARDPKLAADLANAFVGELDRYNRATSVEDARRTSDFIRTCIEENHTRLSAATQALREFQEKHGAVQLVEQGRVTVEAIAELEAERTRLQIQKGVLENYALSDQPQIQEIEAEMREIQKRIDRLRGPTPNAESGTSPPRPSRKADGEVLLRLQDLPSLALQYAELQREVLAQEKVYAFLTAQLEESRIRESRDLQTVKVLDAATPPIQKTRPRRSLIVVLTAVLAFAGALGLAFASEALQGVAASRPDLRESREFAWLFRAAGGVRGWGWVRPTSTSGP